MEFENLQCRYLKLYTGVVGDVLDTMGYWHQMLPGEIQALSLGSKLFGEAFTIEGRAALDNTENDIPLRVKLLGQIAKNSVVVLASQGDRQSAHWGEITGLAARNNGCLGAVVDGGTRDVQQLLDYKFPVFTRFRSSKGSTGRWSVKHWQIPIRVEDVTINPGDYIMGDDDGVIAIPRAIAEKVLLAAEEKVMKEQAMRAALARGETIHDIHEKYGHF